MSDEEWIVGVIEDVFACARDGDGVRRFAVISTARAEANGSALRRMALTTLEACLPKLDGEVTARKYAENMLERFGAARMVTYINGNVAMGPGSIIGEDQSQDKLVSDNGNGRQTPQNN